MQELNIAEEELDDVKEELKQKYRTSNVDEESMRRYLATIKKCMEEEKPYLDSMLTVRMLSEKTSIPSHHLSQTINSYLDQNFYTFVNSYRVSEVEKQLKDSANLDKSLLEIAYSAGFRSKSSFNAIFKRQTGLTPTEYRKKLNKSNFS